MGTESRLRAENAALRLALKGIIWSLVGVGIFANCTASHAEQPAGGGKQIAQWVTPTATGVPTMTVEAPLVSVEAPLVSVATPALPTVAAPAQAQAAVGALSACYENPDRYNWQKYAAQYDWPMNQIAEVVRRESRGDLCAVNASSGAICWIQDISGSETYLDPANCMAQGYRKWVAGGRDFYAHWCRWWGLSACPW